MTTLSYLIGLLWNNTLIFIQGIPRALSQYEDITCGFVLEVMSHTGMMLKTNPLTHFSTTSLSLNSREQRPEVFLLYRKTSPHSHKVLAFMKNSCSEGVVGRNWQTGEQLSISLSKAFISVNCTFSPDLCNRRFSAA